jgi:acyl-CoA thioester hydrolase
MTHIFTTRFRIRQYELDARGELPNSTLLRLFQETATRASQDAGYGVEWYAEHQTVWVVHRMTLEHLRPMRYRDELALTTWVSDIERVRSHREYIARNAATNEIVARGRARWAYLHSETLSPTRIPANFGEHFAPNGVRAVPRVEPRAYALPAPIARREHRARRRVQRYEADEMQHVNNAVYLDWLEQALADAVAAHPSTFLHSAQDAPRLCAHRHDIEYARSALPGDEVEIVTRLAGAGYCASAWELQVNRGEELLVRDHITALWVDDAGKPTRGNW